ncbi:hypothetical protein HML84_06775 [Alcanivorax sp. IO_7]|nr:hypothetical protein HML84_06775 [Alcanivorax sp. IO_7]
MAASLILLLVPVVALLAVPLFGVHWQGIGWRQGLTLDALWYESGGCRQVDVHGARLSGLAPLTLTLDTVGIHDCPATDEPFSLPSLPALDVTVWALQYQDYPPLMARLRQAGGRWRGHLEFRGSELEGVPARPGPLAAHRHPGRGAAVPGPGRGSRGHRPGHGTGRWRVAPRRAVPGQTGGAGPEPGPGRPGHRRRSDPERPLAQ